MDDVEVRVDSLLSELRTCLKPLLETPKKSRVTLDLGAKRCFRITVETRMTKTPDVETWEIRNVEL